MKNGKKKVIILSVIFILILVISVVLLILLNKKPADVLNDEKINEEVIKTFEMEEGVIGYLKIDKINLEAPIKEGIDKKTLNKYVGHFSETALLDGNICLAAHNRGYENNYFQDLHLLENEDIICYITKFDEKKYKVSSVKEINEEDLSVLKSTEENRLTLITCIENKPSKRLCVIAVEDRV